ncbi:MAG: cyclic nucleotide-binding domain-containing protein [Proteobacteria bacterium]|nr:cyclic nucleotide-binding domain-containing protein [Pseudomonadota bacterium]MBU1640301.1 cyclic nucleotide-binding domain-containing protein [Pseudomonadota bacterium]
MGCRLVSDVALAKSFPYLLPEECKILCSFLEYKKCAKDEVFIRQGDPGDFMGFLLTGKLAIKKETSFPGKFVLVAILESGSLVGEISVVEENPRTATVVAMEESEILLLTHSKAQQLLEANPLLAVKLLKKIIRVLGARLQKSSARLAQLL